MYSVEYFGRRNVSAKAFFDLPNGHKKTINHLDVSINDVTVTNQKSSHINIQYIHTQCSWQFKQSDCFAISDYDVIIFTALGGEYKAKQNRCRKMGVLPKFESKNVLKIQVMHPSFDDSEGLKKLHGV